jgi:hypothetical protein
MEAVAVGASVLAFVTLSLKSAKAVQEVLSSAKEGQRHVGQVERDVQSLQLTLERLSRCRLIGERRDEALAAKIKACSDDMEIFAKRLESLAIGDAEPRLGRQWKRIKAFLNEKDLAKMGAVVVGHTVALNLHLNILERHAPIQPEPYKAVC